MELLLVAGAVLVALFPLSTEAQQAARPVSLNAASMRSGDAILNRYFSNDEMVAYMQDHQKRCGGISHMFSIGKSSSGRRDLWVLEISNNPGVVEPKPYIKFVANMHGNEPSGRQVILQYAEWMCRGYPSDPTVARLVDNFHVMLLPSMNPDGYDKHWRGNSRGKDLNRDFPDPIHRARGKGWSDNLGPAGSEMPETSAVMKWSLEYNFVAGVSMHEGAVVANYPWDGSLDRKTHYAACPDDLAYQYLAKLYARNNPEMSNSLEFPGGITNGAQWYPLWGGMQDWNYIMAGCFELTLELSDNKWPNPQLLPGIWEGNKWALVNFTLAATYGSAWGSVKGVEGDLAAAAKPLPGAKIKVAGIAKDLKCGHHGDFYRPLAPGKYIITAEADGFTAQSKEVVVPEDGSGIRLEFLLPRAASELPASRAASPQVPESPEARTGGARVAAAFAQESAAPPAKVPASVAAVGASLSRWQQEATQSSHQEPRISIRGGGGDHGMSFVRVVPAVLWILALLACAGIVCRRSPMLSSLSPQKQQLVPRRNR